jgi:hypothetical protein
VPANTAVNEDAYYASAGLTWDRKLGGTVVIQTMSCGINFIGPGVSLSSDIGGQLYYMTTQGATSLALTETTAFSMGGFANAKPGVGTFTARLAGSDAGGGFVAQVQLLVEPGTVTWALVTPSPNDGWQ